MSNTVDLSQKIVAFQFVGPKSVTVAVEGVGMFRSIDFDTSDFPFPTAELVHYEKAVGLHQMTPAGEPLREMTEEEIATLIEYLKTVPELVGIMLPCYNPEKSNLYVGTMLIGDAEEKGYVPVVATPPSVICKYNTTTDTWNTVKAIITDSGSLILDPVSYCDLCVLFLSEAEWSAFPQPDTTTIPYSLWKWDFETQEWVDSRSVSDVLDLYKQYVSATLQRIEQQMYVEKGEMYYNIIHNPITMRIINKDMDVLNTLVNTTLADSIIGPTFEDAKALVPSKFTDDNTETSFSYLMRDQVKAELGLLKELIARSEMFMLYQTFWFKYPTSCVSAADLTKDHIATVKAIFQKWVTSVYGEEALS